MNSNRVWCEWWSWVILWSWLMFSIFIVESFQLHMLCLFWYKNCIWVLGRLWIKVFTRFMIFAKLLGVRGKICVVGEIYKWTQNSCCISGGWKFCSFWHNLCIFSESSYIKCLMPCLSYPVIINAFRSETEL